jgi:hypothetical protein
MNAEVPTRCSVWLSGRNGVLAEFVELLFEIGRHGLVGGEAVAVVGAPSPDVIFSARRGCAHLGADAVASFHHGEDLAYLVEVVALDCCVDLVIVDPGAGEKRVLPVAVVIPTGTTGSLAILVDAFGRFGFGRVLRDNPRGHVDEACGLGAGPNILGNVGGVGVKIVAKI